MAASDALWNETARLVNIEFFQNGQPLTGEFLLMILLYVREQLTDESVSG